MKLGFLIALVAGIAACKFPVPPFDEDAGVDAGDDGDGGVDAMPDPAMLTTSQRSLAFDDATVGQPPGPTRMVTVRNAGQADSGVVAVSLTGDHPGDFELVPTGDAGDCAGATLEPNAVCVAQVRFRPTMPGPRAATLRVAAMPGGAVTVDLGGHGLTPGDLVIEEGATLGFGTVEIQQQTASQDVVVRNGGQTAIPQLTVILGDATNYTKTADGCHLAPLGGGESCTIRLRFNPTEVGALPTSVSIRQSAEVGVTAAATGTGSARLRVDKTGTGTITSSPAGISCGAGCATETQAFTQTPVTLTAGEVTGHVFGGWGGACASAGTMPTCNVPLNQALTTASATFTQVYTLTVNVTGAGVVTANPAGITCGNGNTDCTETYPVNTMVTLSVAGATGWGVYAWTGASCSPGQTSCTVTMNQARTVGVELRASPPALNLAYGVKTFRFSWTANPAATSYRLFEDPDGPGPAAYAEIASPTGTSYDHTVALHRRVNATYRLQACNANGCGADSAAVTADVARAIGYVKASNTGPEDNFGSSVALSSDGLTLAVGAPYEDSSASGVNGNQNNENAQDAGAVYVFVRSGATWTQQAYVKASNTGAGDLFGSQVTLSSDGNTMAVSAPFEDSSSTGINGVQSNNSAADAGAVYVFTRNATLWSQQAYIKASNTGAGDRFGAALALSGDGNTLAVGAPDEDSAATGINGDQASNAATEAGAVYVFTRSGTTWSQQAYVKASNTDAGDGFAGVALSSNGNTLAVGAAFEDSNATGINGNQANNTSGSSGAVYVFTRSGTTWSQQAYIKASNAGAFDRFAGVTLSDDGNTLAVGAGGEDSDSTGINADQSNNDAMDAGAVYVFTRSGSTWTQQAYIKASNTGAGDQFARAVLSADGNTLAVHAFAEDSGASALNGDQGDDSASNSGAVYIFTRSGITWSQQAYVKASNTGPGDRFGNALALSADGSTLVAGSPFEDSGANSVSFGIGPAQDSNGATNAGAVYLY